MLIQLNNENEDIDDNIVNEIVMLKNGKPVFAIQNYNNHKSIQLGALI